MRRIEIEVPGLTNMLFGLGVSKMANPARLERALRRIQQIEQLRQCQSAQSSETRSPPPATLPEGSASTRWRPLR
jgi:hypothetical protein